MMNDGPWNDVPEPHGSVCVCVCVRARARPCV